MENAALTIPAVASRTYSISVVVPVFNSQDTLGDLVQRLKATLAPITTTYEIILVNDGSRDESWERITALTELHPETRGIDLMRNYGQHNALLAGIRAARNEIVITLDDDLQNPPEEIPKLLAKLDEGYDVVYGTPQKQQHGLWRDLASTITKMVMKRAMDVETAHRTSAFRAFRLQIRESFEVYHSPFVSIDVLLTWGTTRFASVTVAHDPRRVGSSNYTFRKLVNHAINMMTGFSTWPLQLASWIGFGFTFFGLLIFAFVIIRYLVQGGSVPGFPFLASIIAIFSGAQLFALGIIGEYLARMHFRMMGRPPSVTRRTIGFREENA